MPASRKKDALATRILKPLGSTVTIAQRAGQPEPRGRESTRSTQRKRSRSSSASRTRASKTTKRSESKPSTRTVIPVAMMPASIRRFRNHRSSEVDSLLSGAKWLSGGTEPGNRLLWADGASASILKHAPKDSTGKVDTKNQLADLKVGFDLLQEEATVFARQVPVIRSEFERLEEECRVQRQLATTSTSRADRASKHLEDVNRKLQAVDKEKKGLKTQLEKAKSQSSSSRRESELRDQIAKLKQDLAQANQQLPSASGGSSPAKSVSMIGGKPIDYWWNKTHQFEVENAKLRVRLEAGERRSKELLAAKNMQMSRDESLFREVIESLKLQVKQLTITAKANADPST